MKTRLKVVTILQSHPGLSYCLELFSWIMQIPISLQCREAQLTFWKLLESVDKKSQSRFKFLACYNLS